MKFTAIASAALLSSCVAAQTIKSKPFRLVITGAKEKTLNGQTVGACHEGAGFNSLCVGHGDPKDTRDIYHHITTKGDKEQVAGAGVTGAVTWLQPSDLPVTLNMAFYIDHSTNVAHPQFAVGDDVEYVAFDKKGLMNIQLTLDDTHTPPIDNYDSARALYRWYVCDYRYSSYTYTSLNWVLGNRTPENPSCTKVDVKRVFV